VPSALHQQHRDRMANPSAAPIAFLTPFFRTSPIPPFYLDSLFGKGGLYSPGRGSLLLGLLTRFLAQPPSPDQFRGLWKDERSIDLWRGCSQASRTSLQSPAPCQSPPPRLHRQARRDHQAEQRMTCDHKSLVSRSGSIYEDASCSARYHAFGNLC